METIDISREAADLLHVGAANGLGICCRPSQIVKLYPAIREAELAGYLRWVGGNPWITDAGRAAIGAPSQAEQGRVAFIQMCSRRKKLVPQKRDDPRSDFDYRSYRAMGWLCTLVVRQPDQRENPQTTRVGRTLTAAPQFLGARNSIILPESEGRFVLALVPGWMTRPVRRHGNVEPPIFSTYPFALDERNPAFTEEERETWERLRQICYSVNARIRTAGRRQTERFRFGESA